MGSSKSINILVLDDEHFVLKVLGHMLGQMGFEQVRTADNGESALRELDSENPPHLVLLDLNMPGMDGVEFIRALVARKYTGSLILISGENERVLQTVRKLAVAHRISVLGHLRKPVAPNALEELLAGWTQDVAKDKRSRSRTLYNPGQLRAAIRGGELFNHYQPKVAVASGAFVGAEVLVRWQHPHDGLVYPDQFIPIAEQHGLMDELTAAVLAQALAQARAWREAGMLVRMAVNVSMDNLHALSFPDDVTRLATQYGVNAHELLLEVTESRLMQNALAVFDILSRLRLKRVGLAIDDFGTGHSSLAQLRDLPFEQLKIDRGFVHGAHRNRTASAIFGASQAMGKELGMEVVAEGVEDRADWDWLRQSDCDVAQGYFIARPMPAASIGEWLAQWEQRLADEGLLR